MQDQKSLTTAGEDVPRRKTSAKGIFAVDRKAWADVCALGMNAAVAYLTIASGTGLDMVTSKWSVKSIWAYSGMRHNSGKDAIAALAAAGFLTMIGTREKPRYKLTLFDSPTFEPDWIWLPNTLVTGTGAPGEVSPLKLLRQTNRTPVLQLFVDLYHDHDLLNNGGHECRRSGALQMHYIRHSAGEHGIFNLWAFTLDSIDNRTADPEIWRSLFALGLFDLVEHLVDAPDGEIIHPLPLGLTGEAIERDLAIAASAAGKRMAAVWEQRKHSAIIPVEKRIPDATVIGVIRMKYRPHTALTAKWLESLEALRDEIDRYETLAK